MQTPDDSISQARTKIVLALDEDMLQELEGTTELETASGYVRYVPPVRGRDHNTDALRCVMAAIVRYGTMLAGTQKFDARGLGWVDVGRGKWTPPWGA